MKKFFKWLIAMLRLNSRIVCEMSQNKGLYDDYHDWPDSIENYPYHFMQLTCKRCGKKFII